MKRNVFALFLLVTFVFQSVASAQAPAIKVTDAEKKLAAGVTAKQLSDYLYFVASDEMEGRDTPSRGLDTTAKFIGMNLSKWGFKPAGDNGTFYQKIALRRDSVDAAATSVEVESNVACASRAPPTTADTVALLALVSERSISPDSVRMRSAASSDDVTSVVCASRALLRIEVAALLPTAVSARSTSDEVSASCAPTSVETVSIATCAARVPT